MANALMELDLFSLVVFKSIYETQHANVTARALGVSAPKISRCLNALRGMFDDELFYRRQNGLLPTPQAERLYPRVNQLVEGFGQLDEAPRLGDKADKVVRLAILPSYLLGIAQLLQTPEFSGLVEHIELLPWEEGSAEALHRGEIDMGFSLESPAFGDLATTELGRGRQLYLVGHCQHPVWQQLADFSIQSLFQYPFIYQILPGFNDRIDPMEAYCQRTGTSHNGFEGMKDMAHWYARLISSDALSFCGSPLVADSLSQFPSLKLWQFPPGLFDEAHLALGPPVYRLVERQTEYRRYDYRTREKIVRLVSRLFE